MNNKKISYLLVICASALILFPSCDKKKENVITQSIDVTLNLNEVYNITLMENIYGDDLKIDKQASHFSVSKLKELEMERPGKQGAEGSSYTYKPSNNFVGDDEVTFKGEDLKYRECGFVGSNDKDDYYEEATAITTIHFHVVNSTLKH